MLVRDVIIKSLLEGFSSVWSIIKPYIIAILIGTIIISIIKHFVSKTVSSFSVMSGDSQKETRKKVKDTRNLIDLFSNFKDIFPKK